MKRNIEKLNSDSENISSTYAVLLSKGPKEKKMKLAEIFGEVSKEIFEGGHIARALGSGTYEIHSVSTLAKLIAAVFDKPNQGTSIRLRFIMTPDEVLGFAREGFPSGLIPAHFQMTGAVKCNNAKCLTAGNVDFNRNHEVVRVSHKSGDFHPSFASLQLALAAMIENGIKFAETVEIADFSNKHEVLHIVSAEEIRELVNDRFSKIQRDGFKDMNKDVPSRFYTYTNEKSAPRDRTNVRKPKSFADRLGELPPEPEFGTNAKDEPIDERLKDAVANSKDPILTPNREKATSKLERNDSVPRFGRGLFN